MSLEDYNMTHVTVSSAIALYVRRGEASLRIKIATLPVCLRVSFVQVSQEWTRVDEWRA